MSTMTRLDGTNNLAAYHRANPAGDPAVLWQVLVALADRIPRDVWDDAITEATR